ncbi:hypothetical protein NMY22_g10057 [Coprinellus aureogranulatus]|nr:hypothetical protein NMY22_g10057 [Coprinellus aureogranulatus]
MDYLRTLGSAAVSTLVAKSGLNSPFSLGSKVPTGTTIYSLYEGTKRDDGSPVSIFEFDFTDPSKRNTKPLAINALRKLRTTRHPDVLKFMDAVESESNLYIMTERVRPLTSVLPSWASKTDQEREDWLLWGLHRISIALAFINDSCASTHGNVCSSSIFISPSGEWKLGGFELLSTPKDESAVLYTMGGLLPGSNSLAPPEVKKSGWSILKSHDVAVADAYALGLLLHAVFNPTHPLPTTVEPPHPPPTPSSRGAIPLPIFALFKKLVNPNPSARATPKHFLDVGMAESGFFAGNKLVKVCLGRHTHNISRVQGDENMGRSSRNVLSTGRQSEAAPIGRIPNVTSARVAAHRTMAPKTALVRNKGIRTPYKASNWEAALREAGLYECHEHVVQGLRNGFILGLPNITQTQSPSNNITSSEQREHFRSIIRTEVEKGRYIGPLTHEAMEAFLGPFQSSPISIIPKSTPGKFRLIQNFSFPYKPSTQHPVPSPNSYLNSDDFPYGCA